MKYTNLPLKKLAIWSIMALLVTNSVISNVNAVSVLEKEEIFFQLHILKKSRDQLKLQGETEDWTTLQKVDLSSETMLTLTEKDIESYNWPDQLITLTPESSMKLLSCLGIIGDRLAKIKEGKLVLNLERILDSAVFIVVLEGKKLYGGTFSNRISTKGTHEPTIFPQIVNVISIGPFQLQIGFVMRPLYTLNVMLNGYKALETSFKNRIEIPKVRDFFQKIGKLTHDDSPNRVDPWMPKIESVVKKAK